MNGLCTIARSFCPLDAVVDWTEVAAAPPTLSFPHEHSGEHQERGTLGSRFPAVSPPQTDLIHHRGLVRLRVFMAVRLDPGCLRIGVAPAEFRTSSPSASPSPSPQPCTSPNWTIDVSDVRTIKVTNVPLSATAENMKEFFSFSGEIEYVEMRRDSETSQVAYVTFKEFHGADTALLLSGSSMCGDVPVNIAPVEDYELPPEAYSQNIAEARSPAAEEVVSTMLAKGFVLSKDALRRAQSFDGRHQRLLSTATARVASLDRRLGLSDKFSLGTAAARGAARGVDERFQVTERAWGAFSAAGEVVAGSPYASRGAAWVSAAVGAVARAASDVGAMTMEKVVRAEEEGGTAADGPGADAGQGHAAARVDVHDGQHGDQKYG